MARASPSCQGRTSVTVRKPQRLANGAQVPVSCPQRSVAEQCGGEGVTKHPPLIELRGHECYDVMNIKYDVHMRTTISLDDRLGEQIRREAAAQGLSVSAFIARVLDNELKRTDEAPTTPFRLVSVGEGGVYPGIDLDKPSTLLVADDETAYGSGDAES